MDESTLEKQKLRILFLASEPTDTGRLRLGAELQEIRNKLSTNSFYEIKDRHAVKPDDVLQTILNYKPHIVHFSGHGKDSGEICFEDENGKSKIIPPDALAELFKHVNDYVKCVLVNTCYSEDQAKAIAQYVPIVVGTKKDISDSAALKFSTGFYTALDPDLSQKSLRRAFDSGCIAVRFENLEEHLTPILIEGSPEVRFSSEVDTAFLPLSKPEGLVFETLKRGLTLTGVKMGVSENVVYDILDEKIRKLALQNTAINEYETHLKNLLGIEFPLSETSNLALLQLQNGLELSQEDVEIIHKKILSNPNLNTAENWYDRGRAQYESGNYEKSIEYYSQAIVLDSDYSGAYYERGITYDKMGDYNNAIADFGKALEFNNKWELSSSPSATYFARGLALYDFKPEDEKLRKENVLLAIEDWKKSIDFKYSERSANYNIGLAHEYFGDLDEAIKYFAISYDIGANEQEKQISATKLAKCYSILEKRKEEKKWTEIALAHISGVGNANIDDTNLDGDIE